MRKFIAVRNIKLCTKDCLCLYSCPTGATDTENGQVDASKCIGCGICVNACPSHALSLVPVKYPETQRKTEKVCQANQKVILSKIKVMNIANNLEKNSIDNNEKRLLKAIATSNKVMAEDMTRESKYLLPQGDYTILLLNELLKKDIDDLNKDELKTLISSLENDKL